MSLLLYNLFLLLYRAGVSIAALFNPKARLWIEGRRNWQASLKASLGDSSRPLIWMHAASLGEFEQGRPLLEYIRSNYPQYRLLVSFFSPSGYEVRKNYAGADYVCYLPADGARASRQFIELIQPSLVLWVRYEYWYHYLHCLQKKKIPVLLVAGLFRNSQPFFKWYGNLHRSMLGCFTQLFLQDEASNSLLKSIGINNAMVSGDTRYDRVSSIAEKFSALPLIEKFIAGRKTVVAGSTWTEDEKELDHFANTRKEYCFIIAPHELSVAHLDEIKGLFKHSIRYSDWEKNPSAENEANTLVIDNIGMLSKLYHYARVAFIGGGFGDDGLHNILEAAVYGIPVMHGPVYDRFPEAIDLVDAGGSFAVGNALELEKKLKQLMEDDREWSAAGKSSATFVQRRRGATEKIINYAEANRLLTN